MKLGEKAEVCLLAFTVHRDRQLLFINGRKKNSRQEHTLRGHIWIRNVHRLQRRHDLLSLHFSVRLHDGQPQRSGPHDRRHLFLLNAGSVDSSGFDIVGRAGFLGDARRFSDAIAWDGFGDQPCRECEPELNVFGRREKIANSCEGL